MITMAPRSPFSLEVRAGKADLEQGTLLYEVLKYHVTAIVMLKWFNQWKCLEHCATHKGAQNSIIVTV